MRAYGYALVEDERPGRFDLEAAKRLGVPEGPAFAALQRGEEVAGRRRPGRAPSRWWAQPRPGRTIVITGDTAPSPGDGRRRAPTPSCWSTTPASPRRRRSGPPKPATRRSARRPRSPARRRSRCSPSSTSPPATTSAQVLEEAREVFETDRRPPRLRPHRDPLPRARATPSWSRTEPATRRSGTARPNLPQFVRARPYRTSPPALLRCGRPLTRSREARKEAKE